MAGAGLGALVIGLFFYTAGWTTWETRFVVASDRFERTNARLGSAVVALGAALIFGSLLGALS